jgi:tRNA A-37 threonylcarbamoyl transferase component Bud32
VKTYLADNPDDLFAFATQHLKDSKRSRVSIIDVNGKTYILKRYNLKNVLHKLRRRCQPSVAWKTWKATHLLAERGVLTPRILAALDLRNAAGYQGTFALYEYLAQAQDSTSMIKRYFLNPSTRQFLLKKMAACLWELHQRGVYHGDAKVNNFIWDEKNGEIHMYVIDLDSVRFVREVSNWQRLSDLKNLASSLGWWAHSIDPPSALLDYYARWYHPWKKGYVFWRYWFKKKAAKQLSHRQQRQRNDQSWDSC